MDIFYDFFSTRTSNIFLQSSFLGILFQDRLSLWSIWGEKVLIFSWITIIFFWLLLLYLCRHCFENFDYGKLIVLIYWFMAVQYKFFDVRRNAFLIHFFSIYDILGECFWRLIVSICRGAVLAPFLMSPDGG